MRTALDRRRSMAAFTATVLCAVLAHDSFAGGASTGLVPLTQLPPASYQGFEGGLYPGGVNIPPQAHFAAAMAASQFVRPRDAAGAVDNANGKIVMIAIGMSNTNQGFAPFERQEDLNTDRNARVLILDTAQGGQSAAIISDPGAAYWSNVNNRIIAAGASPLQVQVAWVKEANANPTAAFPIHAQTLQSELVGVMQNLHDKFPNLRLVYVSSRTYGGYAAGSLNPEPFAYESAFSVKWLIEQQIGGDPSLNHSPDLGVVRAPLILWGPYLWADGLTPRVPDGLIWQPSDFESDGTHPAPTGEQKVGDMLSAFFASETSASPWWAPRPGRALLSVDAAADATVDSAAPNAPLGSGSTLDANGGAAPRVIYLKFDVSHIARPVRHAKLSLRNTTSGPGGGGAIFLVGDTTWSESAITWINRPAPDAAALLTVPNSSRDGVFAADITNAVNDDTDGVVSLAIAFSTGGSASMMSRESGQPPRLILTAVAPVCIGDANGSGAVSFADLTAVLAGWGTIGPAGDADEDGFVSFEDITAVLAHWGEFCAP